MRVVPTIIVAASLVAVSGLGVAARSDTAVTVPVIEVAPTFPAVRMTKPERVFFIGNSHTYTNGGIDLHVGRMSQAAAPGRPFQAESVTMSGATLEEHWQLDSQGRIPEGDFDVVVLQGHLPRSADHTDSAFLDYVRRFHEVARRSGADTVLFMSGPHRDFPDTSLKDIIKAHRKVAHELGVKVAPVAIANRKVGKQRPDMELLSGDGVHASWAGTYLAAAVIYATLFDESPLGIDYAFGVSDPDADYLQQVAWETLNEWNAGLDP